MTSQYASENDKSQHYSCNFKKHGDIGFEITKEMGCEGYWDIWFFKGWIWEEPGNNAQIMMETHSNYDDWQSNLMEDAQILKKLDGRHAKYGKPKHENWREKTLAV